MIYIIYVKTYSEDSGTQTNFLVHIATHDHVRD